MVGRRGAKPITARDWIFGSRPRRLALRFVLNTKPPAGGWTKTDIANRCEVGAKGGIDEHVQGLLAIGLLEEQDGRYAPTAPSRALSKHLAKVIKDVESLPEERITELLGRGRVGPSERHPPDANQG